MISNPAFICSIISIVSTFISAIFFAIPLLLKDEEIEKISRTHGGPNQYSSDAINPHMKNALMKDRRNAQIGLCLLSIGVEFQIFSIYFK